MPYEIRDSRGNLVVGWAREKQAINDAKQISLKGGVYRSLSIVKVEYICEVVNGREYSSREAYLGSVIRGENE